MKKINLKELEAFKEERRDFVLYVRSDREKEKVKEVFDTDVVIPELERVFYGKIEFFFINVDDDPEALRDFPLPSLVLFKKGVVKQVLKGIKAWNEYLKTLAEVYNQEGS